MRVNTPFERAFSTFLWAARFSLLMWSQLLFGSWFLMARCALSFWQTRHEYLNRTAPLRMPDRCMVLRTPCFSQVGTCKISNLEQKRPKWAGIRKDAGEGADTLDRVQ